MSTRRAPKARTVEHAGATYAFCNPRCAEKFRADPGKYLPGPEDEATEAAAPSDGGSCCGHHAAAAAPVTRPAAAPGTYTCPMHPEVVRDGPGDCPICGMALEPVLVTLEEPSNPELADMTRRLVVSVVLTVPVFVIAMGGMIPG